jgi:hypothetical protein
MANVAMFGNTMATAGQTSALFRSGDVSMATKGVQDMGSEDGRISHRGIQRLVPPPKGRGRKMRSAVTSGRKLLIDGDPNSAWARRYADLIVGHVADAGGRDLVSDAKLSIIRRAASMECEIERLEAKLSRGENVDLDAFGRAASHLRRLFESIGIDRKQRDLTLDPQAYFYENS